MRSWLCRHAAELVVLGGAALIVVAGIALFSIGAFSS
jgi:hypothetical protein